MERYVLSFTLLLCISQAGCYSYRGGAVSRIDMGALSAPSRERLVVLIVKAESNVGADAEILAIATRQLESVLQAAGANVRESGAVAEPDSTLVVSVYVQGSVARQVLAGFIQGLTLALFPTYAGFDVILSAEVVAQDGRRHRYRYSDTLSTWFHIFLLPVTNSPNRVLEDLIGDMVRSLARDLQRDDLLPRPEAAKRAVGPHRPSLTWFGERNGAGEDHVRVKGA